MNPSIFQVMVAGPQKMSIFDLKITFNVYSVYLYGVMIHQNVDRNSIFHYIQKKFNSDIIEKLFSSGDVFFSLSLSLSR